MACAALAACLAGPALAIDPHRTMSQYVRDRWSTDAGFPRGPVYAINQTSDGYLWIGAERGLVRFDGQVFQLMQPSAPGLPTVTHVLGLFPGGEGSLWARLRRPTLLRFAGGAFEEVLERLGRPRTSIAAMGRTFDGALLLWVLEGEPSAIALRGNRFETLAKPEGFSRSPVLAIAQTPNGDIWVGTRDAGLFRLANGRTHAVQAGLPDPKVNALAPAANGDLWVGTDAGVVRWNGSELTKSGIPAALDGEQALALTVDQDANLWVGTNSRGLLRVNARGVAALDDSPRAAHDAVTAVFEDREGNLWVGDGGGIERLRDSAFTSYSLPEGLPSDGSNPVYADANGRVWFASTSGGLWWLEAGASGHVRNDGLDGDTVYSIAGAKDSLWVGRQRGGLTNLRYSNGSFIAKTYTQADGLAQDSVYSVYQSRDNAVWAGTLSGGVTRLQAGRLATYTTGDGIASNTIAAILESTNGTMWFATPEGLSALTGKQWRTYGPKQGLPSADINCFLEDSTGVLWVGTAAGLAFASGNRFDIPGKAPAALREEIFGLAEDRFGALWISTANHVLRVDRDKLRRAALGENETREYGRADGLRGVEGVKRHRSVVTDPAGKIWFSLNRGISVVDPARLQNNAVPAMVHIQSISANGLPLGAGRGVRVPGGKQRIAIRYTGISLSVPERVRYRYQLDGFDRSWSEPVSAREAGYTNLAPGPYRFRVMASNPDGVWSAAEAAVSFEVDPLFWQTAWFQAGLLFACLLTGVGFYRLRLRQVTRGMKMRFEERLAERTRIAQELHDTLLQGFLSASMQVHVAAGKLPDQTPEKALLSRALQLMTQVIEEGRNAVRGLRSTGSASLDLEHAFARVQQEVAAGGGTGEFRVIVDGQARPLHPLLRDEVYRIGREALTNAFRHARATNVELELKYSRKDLRLLVRDDGRGIDATILTSGKEGHWGLSGMRERAEQIGAQLHVWSSPAGGTEIELTVPAQVAFQDSRKNGILARFGQGRKSQ